MGGDDKADLHLEALGMAPSQVDQLLQYQLSFPQQCCLKKHASSVAEKEESGILVRVSVCWLRVG